MGGGLSVASFKRKYFLQEKKNHTSGSYCLTCMYIWTANEFPPHFNGTKASTLLHIFWNTLP
jgi:hypothetical protein